VAGGSIALWLYNRTPAVLALYNPDQKSCRVFIYSNNNMLAFSLAFLALFASGTVAQGRPGTSTGSVNIGCYGQPVLDAVAMPLTSGATCVVSRRNRKVRSHVRMRVSRQTTSTVGHSPARATASARTTPIQTPTPTAIPSACNKLVLSPTATPPQPTLASTVRCAQTICGDCPKSPPHLSRQAATSASTSMMSDFHFPSTLIRLVLPLASTRVPNPPMSTSTQT